MEEALGKLINIMNPYSNPGCQPFHEGRRMKFAASDPEQAVAGDPAEQLRQIALEMDNYGGGEWTFMGQMYKIRRALLVPYRYEVRNRDGAASGVWATANLLVGYTGGNGGG